MPVFAQSAIDARKRRDASIFCYLQETPSMSHGRPRYRVGFRQPDGKWRSRLFAEKADAEQFKMAYDRATIEQRWELLRTTREQFLEAKTEIARRAFGPDHERRRNILSALYYRDGRAGRRPYYEAWCRLPGGRWRSKSFQSEQEARAWIKICLTAIAKAIRLKRAEGKQKRFEADYGESVARFKEEAYTTTPTIVPKRAPLQPSVNPPGYVDLA